MKRLKSAVSIFLIIVMLSALFTVCASAEAVERNGNVITVKASDEAAAKREKMLAANGNASFLEENFELVRAKLLEAKPQTFPEVEVRNRLEKESCEGSDVYTLSNGEYENIVLYIHGGAWVYGIDPLHVSFCDELVDRLNAKVYMPLYPLAPKYSYEDTYKMTLALYDELLGQGKSIFVMGDSAGGTISLGLINIIKETGRKMPDKLIPISPCADMTFSNPDMKETEKRDPMLGIYGCRECAKMWAKDTDLADPVLSAVKRDVSGYPDTMMFAASNDILGADDLILFNMLKKAGNNVTLVKGEGLWHVFAVSDIPEREISLDLITEFCMK